MGMLAVYLAVLIFVVFVVGVWRDPRSFSNAVLLGLCLALGALGAVGTARQLPGASGDLARVLVAVLGLVVALGPFLVASYLVLNGITMARRESIRLGNLLSLLAGLAIRSRGRGRRVTSGRARRSVSSSPCSSATRWSTSASAR